MPQCESRLAKRCSESNRVTPISSSTLQQSTTAAMGRYCFSSWQGPLQCETVYSSVQIHMRRSASFFLSLTVIRPRPRLRCLLFFFCHVAFNAPHPLPLPSACPAPDTVLSTIHYLPISQGSRWGNACCCLDGVMLCMGSPVGLASRVATGNLHRFTDTFVLL